jgi:hypothetical protein
MTPRSPPPELREWAVRMVAEVVPASRTGSGFFAQSCVWLILLADLHVSADAVRFVPSRHQRTRRSLACPAIQDHLSAAPCLAQSAGQHRR